MDLHPRLPEAYKLLHEGALALADVEHNGFRVDTGRLAEQARLAAEKAKALEDRLRSQPAWQAWERSFGRKASLSKDDQLRQVFFKELGHRPLAFTAKGKEQASEDAFAHINDPFVGDYFAWKGLQKLKGTYLEGIARECVDGLVHTSFNMVNTVSYRLSCLTAGTLVNTRRGLVGIETVRAGDEVHTPFGPRRVLAWQQTGEKPVVSIRLSNGLTLRCSGEHMVRSRGRWVHAADLEPGDVVYMTFRPGMFGTDTALSLSRTTAYMTRKSPPLPDRWTSDLAEFVGYFMADGCIARSNYNDKPSKVSLSFGWDDQEVVDRMASLTVSLFGKTATYRVTASCPVLDVSSADVAGALEQLGAGGLSGAKRVPAAMYTAPEEIVSAFLRGYFEGDGSTSGGQIQVRSTSREMLTDVQQLLTLFGIPSTVVTDGPDPRGHDSRHTLRVLGDRSKVTFCHKIGFMSARKRSESETSSAADKSSSTSEVLTLPDDYDRQGLKRRLYDAHRDESGRVPQAMYVFTSRLTRGEKAGLTLARAESALGPDGADMTLAATDFIHEVVAGQFYEVEVEQVSVDGMAEMYDIAVEGVEQYMAQGTLVHNSSEPNLQNIPARDEEMMHAVRGCFIPSPGNRLVEVDLSGAEVRVGYCYHLDPTMREYLLDPDSCMHADTACELFFTTRDVIAKGKPAWKALRPPAKGFVFAQQYGDVYFQCAAKLWRDLNLREAGGGYKLKMPDGTPVIEHLRANGITGLGACDPKKTPLPGTYEHHVKRVEDSFWQVRFPRYTRWKRKLLSDYDRLGYFDLMTGFRIRGVLRKNQVINLGTQGSASHLILQTLIVMNDWLRREDMKAKLVNTIHDSIVADVPDDEVNDYLDAIEWTIKEYLPRKWPWITIPLEIEAEVTPIDGAWDSKKQWTKQEGRWQPAKK